MSHYSLLALANSTTSPFTQCSQAAHCGHYPSSLGLLSVADEESTGFPLQRKHGHAILLPVTRTARVMEEPAPKPRLGRFLPIIRPWGFERQFWSSPVFVAAATEIDVFNLFTRLCDTIFYMYRLSDISPTTASMMRPPGHRTFTLALLHVALTVLAPETYAECRDVLVGHFRCFAFCRASLQACRQPTLYQNTTKSRTRVGSTTSCTINPSTSAQCSFPPRVQLTEAPGHSLVTHHATTIQRPMHCCAYPPTLATCRPSCAAVCLPWPSAPPLTNTQLSPSHPLPSCPQPTPHSTLTVPALHAGGGPRLSLAPSVPLRAVQMYRHAGRLACIRC
jgi:hypothetical protein